ncbi:hypothetical protein LTR78_003990 [Recurvomyces mirabilis]|uniref:Uncharacterized protein n=1 Tax=Recurvomyces mirabilis TaxID=574656 RepID=A0AAE1C310_9PEZI|nr:hypothetical protein LTR78_003990 [Recurvomyces mirabilis]KAK5153872.1 hypothetical protein LTS14_007092 [Recurvomyces mirabilis]
MQIRSTTPSGERTTSPATSRRSSHNIVQAQSISQTPTIPQVTPTIPQVTPSASAFLQQAAMMKRYRLEGNAFYQQEVHRRRITPPTGTHPALRTRSDSDSFCPLQHVEMLDPRGSTLTTMSSFIDAANVAHGPSPPMGLLPENERFAEPTHRGIIEELREQSIHEASGSEDDRTPVYQTYAPTPKPESSEFTSHTQPTGHRTPRKSRVFLPRKDTGTLPGSIPPKSPKKTFFKKLGMKRTNTTPSPSVSTLTGHEVFVVDEAGIPVKAQAVLGASPSKATLIRSPSKQKKLFPSLRKAGDVTSVPPPTLRSPTSMTSQETPRTAGSLTKTPQIAYTDPTHYSSLNSRHIPSQTLSEMGAPDSQQVAKCAIQRSQSLKYFDSGVPPTPPAKNTPPNIKAAREAAAAAGTLNVPPKLTESTPSKSPLGVISTSDRISPTRFGSYAHKETARLVTKPSMYSLHASVVPEVMEASTFEEMKARIDGLGLEGFSLPEETQYQRSPEMIYSPSIYGSEWDVRPSMTEKNSRASKRFSVHELPVLAEVSAEREGSHRAKQSSSSGGTIPVCYPHLASDHAMSDSTPLKSGHVRSNTSPDLERVKGESLKSEMPVHGRTHSRDHSNSPRQSTDVNIFALPAEELYDAELASPASKYYPSAMPSPLHYLPATVYTPPVKRTREELFPPTNKNESSSCHDSGLGISHQRSASSSPARSQNVLQGAPKWQAPSDSPPLSHMFQFGKTTQKNLEPEKSVAKEGENSKMDKVLAMLQTISTRSNKVEELNEEMRATNISLEGRLGRMEDMQRCSSPGSSFLGSDGTSSQRMQDDRLSGKQQKRVSTSVAHDFYRLGQTQDVPSSPLISLSSADEDVLEDSMGIHNVGIETENEDKIAGLTKANRELTDLLAGLAAQLAEMRKKLDEQAG